MEDYQVIYLDDNDPLNNSFVSQLSNIKTRTRQNSITSIESVTSCPASKIAFSCEYCNTKNHDLLVKCIDQSCNRWFCNNDKVKGAAGSHIILHLNKAGHKVIELHNKRHCRIGKIKCIRCGNNKLFSLGMLLETKHIVCRDCVMIGNIGIDEWSVLVKDRKIDNRLINHNLPHNKKPSNFNPKNNVPRYVKKAPNVVTVSQIDQIEKLYMNYIKDEVVDISSLEYDHRICLKYPNIATYKHIMENLLQLNKISEEKSSTRNVIKDIIFFLDEGTRDKGFFFGVDYGCKFTERDEIKITSSKIANWDAVGKITSISDGKFFISLSKIAPASLNKVNLSVINDSSIYDRLFSGLKRFNAFSQSQDILEAILGTDKKAEMKYFFNCIDYSLPDAKKKLNSSQSEAIRKAMKYKYSVIQGPPGTGKTETIVTLVYHITNLWRRSEEYIKEKEEREKIIKEHQKAIEVVKKKIEEFSKKNRPKIDSLSSKACKTRNNFEMEIHNYCVKMIDDHKESIEIKTYENKNLRQNIVEEISSKNFSKESFKNHTSQILENIKKSAQRQAKIRMLDRLDKSDKSFLKLGSNSKNINYINNSENNFKVEEQEVKENKEIIKDEKINDLIKAFDIDEELERIHESYNSEHKILVCAASNTAVNLLKERLVLKGIKTIQIYAKYKENEYKDDKYSLHYLTKTLIMESEEIKNAEEAVKQVEEDIKYYEFLVPRTQENDNKIEKLKNQLRYKIHLVNDIKMQIQKEPLINCEVICCTCLSTHQRLLENFRFQHVIFDEATQALEIESLLCLTKGAEHFVLVGDVKQLGAVIQSKESNTLGLDVPLIERLIDLKMPQTLLNVQYRMHPDISCFSNENFYQGSIINGVNEQERTLKNFEFPMPVASLPTFFYDVCSDEELSGSGDSYLNRFEAEAIREILQYMYDHNICGSQIGIITFYDGQKGHLKTYLFAKLSRKFVEEIEILSVDASQGKEKDIILLSCVRANMSQGVGFLDEFRRLNVALTRAKYNMIICGHIETLLSSSLWCKLLKFYSDRGLVFSGHFKSLSLVEIELGDEDVVVQRPKKYRKENDFIVEDLPDINE
ncbi:hypothetical protein SteCoe_16052 [Stentor coeruleus]|uniref:Upf1 domain-containing protein n=1 Tax=Stentor coeruleus TaxID=5963 RepID=A0A1R2C1Z5_9CILI|nr:hypothetical protein SteCoe_16052 [Stentor coeruleus]